MGLSGTGMRAQDARRNRAQPRALPPLPFRAHVYQLAHIQPTPPPDPGLPFALALIEVKGRSGGES